MDGGIIEGTAASLNMSIGPEVFRSLFCCHEGAALILVKDSIEPWIVVKSTVPVGYTAALRTSLNDDRLLFSPEFLREGRALYDNLHPSRIVVGVDQSDEEAVRFGRRFARLLVNGSEDASVPVTYNLLRTLTAA